jgi:ribonuclease HI
MICHIETDASVTSRVAGTNYPMRIGYTIKVAGTLVARAGLYAGEGTINRAEYLALIHALRHALRLGFTAVECKTDSQLLARQCSGGYRVKDKHLAKLSRELKGLLHLFTKYDILWTPREGNEEADELTHRTVYEEPELYVRGRQPGNGGRHLRIAAPWQVARIRKWWEDRELNGVTEGIICRTFGFDITTLRQMVRRQTYTEATSDGTPDWGNWDGRLLSLWGDKTCIEPVTEMEQLTVAHTGSLDDGTGWPDDEDLDDLIPVPETA